VTPPICSGDGGAHVVPTVEAATALRVAGVVERGKVGCIEERVHLRPATGEVQDIAAMGVEHPHGLEFDTTGERLADTRCAGVADLLNGDTAILMEEDRVSDVEAVERVEVVMAIGTIDVVPNQCVGRGCLDYLDPRAFWIRHGDGEVTGTDLRAGEELVLEEHAQAEPDTKEITYGCRHGGFLGAVPIHFQSDETALLFVARDCTA